MSMFPRFDASFPDECDRAGLSDAAFRTHVELVIYLFRLEQHDLTIFKRTLSRILCSIDSDQGLKELIEVGFWRDDGDRLMLEHQAGFTHGSLNMQHNYRERNRRSQKAHRERHADT